jgi:integral membrane protein (TIGR01906 family)
MKNIKMNHNKLILIVFCIFLPLFLLLFSYKVVLGLSDLTENQQETIDFLNNKQELNLNYTTNEVSHLEDVKGVMNLIDYLFYFRLIIITLIITYYRKNKDQLKKLFKCGGITTLISIGLILLFVLISFNTTFTIFHQIFFPQGNWLFPIDSLLIQTFPIGFFIGISVKIFLLTMGLGSIFIGVSYYLKYVRSKRN